VAQSLFPPEGPKLSVLVKSDARPAFSSFIGKAMVLGDLRISGDGRCGDEGTDGAGYNGHAREAGVDGTSTPASPVPKRSKKAQY
jgi:hypothetical protein